MENLAYKYRKEMLEIILYIIVLAVIITISGYLYNKRRTENKERFLSYNYIYNDVNVNDTNLGGLTEEQALNVLEKQVQEVYNEREINLINPITGEIYKYNFGKCGADYDFEKAVEQAYKYGRTGDLQKDFDMVVKLQNISYFTHADYETNPEILSKLVDEIASKVEASGNVKVDKELAQKSIKTIVDTAIPGDVVIPLKQEG